MELYVNPQITGFRQDVDGTIKELKIGTNKEDAYANIIEQGADAKLENNKTATIDVSTYTEPVEVTPTAGKDGMKKATITLSNIPSPGGGTTLYAWEESRGSLVYTNTATPEVDDIAMGVSTGDLIECTISAVGEGTITASSTVLGEFTYTRNSEKDVSF